MFRRKKTPGGDVMGPKLLFLIGIVATHGAVGAALMREETPRPTPVSSCVYAPEPLPHFQAQAELLAMYVGKVTTGDSMQP
jgi:hypothetical protein